MRREWVDAPETVVSLRSVDKRGEETTYDDCVAGIQLRERGVLQIDLRSPRPMRIKDRENLIIEMDIRELMEAIGDYVARVAKD